MKNLLCYTFGALLLVSAAHASDDVNESGTEKVKRFNCSEWLMSYFMSFDIGDALEDTDDEDSDTSDFESLLDRIK